MRILIIGVSHQIQSAQIENTGMDAKFEQGQKDDFGSFVRSKILEYGVQFIGEETLHGQESVTQQLCTLNNWPYANIEMTPEGRRARNIPPDYQENQNLPETERARCQREREEYMFARILREGGAMSILIICGSNHTAPLADRFRELGHSVETTDLRDEDWYIEDWLQHMRNL